jgi:hypothetical protein
MRTDKGDHDHRNQNWYSILPKPRDEAEQKGFAEDKNPSELAAQCRTLPHRFCLKSHHPYDILDRSRGESNERSQKEGYH